ncbi:MAG TPA: ATP-binding protein, partial [Candidatus Acidoferrum sp.]|nr:ATP-binding protein [Candidatus Acidoferrum sp.]
EVAGHSSAALERIRARMELLDNEQRYRALVERLPVAVFVQQEGEIVFVNSALLKLLRANSQHDILGRNISQFIDPARRDAVLDRIQGALQGKQPSWMEQQIVRLDQTITDVEACSIGTTHAGKTAVQTILIEISERKHAEQRQTAQYAATRILAQSTNNPKIMEQFLRCVCDGLGWQVAELYLIDGVARGLKLHTAVHPDAPPFMAFAEALRNQSFRKGDGLPGRVWETNQVLWASNLAHEPGFPRRELAGWAGLRSCAAFPVTVRDEFAGVILLFATETRDSEPALFELFKVLGTQFGQFLERKQIQQQLLQAQKMEAIGQLAGGVAHDFNNLLTIITGHSQLALASPELPPQLADELHQISGAADRAANLTRQLLAFSRKQVIQTKPLRLNEVLNELAKMLRRIIGEQITLTLQHAPGLPTIEGDVGMIEQVVMNLAVNARDAMPEGGDLLIRTDTVTLDVEHAQPQPPAREGKFVRVEVRDNGYGMNAEVLSHIFEPFFTTKPVGQGTGLGLATAYGIVKQHNGWIETDSHPGVGTTFRLLFPVSEQNVTVPKTASTADRAVRGGNETILLVEDEPSLRRLARKLLERAGYRVVDAESGQQALEVWEKHHAEIRLVLTDMVMPGGMSGRDLAMRLRQQSPGLRIIFTSGYTTEIAGNLLEREKIEFLAKPYSPQQLTELIRKTLNDKRE